MAEIGHESVTYNMEPTKSSVHIILTNVRLCAQSSASELVSTGPSLASFHVPVTRDCSHGQAGNAFELAAVATVSEPQNINVPP